MSGYVVQHIKVGSVVLYVGSCRGGLNYIHIRGYLSQCTCIHGSVLVHNYKTTALGWFISTSMLLHVYTYYLYTYIRYNVLSTCVSALSFVIR